MRLLDCTNSTQYWENLSYGNFNKMAYRNAQNYRDGLEDRNGSTLCWEHKIRNPDYDGEDEEFIHPDRRYIMKLWEYCYKIIRYANPGCDKPCQLDSPHLNVDGWAEFVRRTHRRSDSYVALLLWACELFNNTYDYGYQAIACVYKEDVIFMDHAKYGCHECVNLFPDMNYLCGMCTDCVKPYVPAIVKLQSFMRGRSTRWRYPLFMLGSSS